MKQEVQELIQIRDYLPTDFNFIKNTLIPGVYYGNSYNKDQKWVKGAPVDLNSLVDRKTFEEAYERVLMFILTKPDTKVMVAGDKLEPDVAYGYSIFSEHPGETILHYIFVKPVWRKQGIGKDLFPPNVKQVTHLTKTGVSLLNKYKLKYNPFKL